MSIFYLGRHGLHRGKKDLNDLMQSVMDKDVIQINERSVSLNDGVTLKPGITIQGDPSKPAPVLVPTKRKMGLFIKATSQGEITFRHLRLQLGDQSIGLRINSPQMRVNLDDVQIYHQKSCNTPYNSLVIQDGSQVELNINRSLIDNIVGRVARITVHNSNLGDWYWPADEISQLTVNQGTIDSTALQNILILGMNKNSQLQITNSAFGGDVKFQNIQAVGDTISLTQFPIVNHQGTAVPSDKTHAASTSLIVAEGAKVKLSQVTQAQPLDQSKFKIKLPEWRTIGMIGGSLTLANAYLSNTGLKNIAHGGDLTMENVTDDSQWDRGNKWQAGGHMKLSNHNSHSSLFDTIGDLPITGAGATVGHSKTALQKLDEMIGLKPVKKQIHQFVNNAKASAERQKRGLGNSKLKRRLNMIFAGNAGVGKTTVAKLVAQALFEAGVLPSSTFHNVGAADLVSQYVGKTAQKTHAVIMKSLDGVLLIDEAYALNSGGDSGSGNNFNQDAITQLVKDMDNYANRLVVIAAGYTQPMKEFLSNNQGLSSRFPNKIYFPDYSPLELKQIMRLDLKKAKARIANRHVIEMMDRGIDQLLPVVSRGEGSGNGRFVDNYVQTITQMRDNRLAQGDMSKLSDLQLMIIQPQDVQNAIQMMTNQGTFMS